ncbi:MAG: PQQ-binding-like beta-propeller repeat protein, partial [Planctomycetales bacterium]|nr:PQQ-binding-like beta-propeller repeat protein [Planctomycetales bacterium]
MRRILIFLLSYCFLPTLAVADWPVHQQNNQRNAKTDEHIDATRLRASWIWKSPHAPRPAWGGPAKWDAYAGIRDLQSMRNYDPVFHVVASIDRVYFGSSADHQVRCLNAIDGSVTWSFTADGPVRIAPAIYDGKVYFGSDDGFAYCLRSSDGWPVWRVAAKPCDRLILNNGNFISQWPIRTGVVVENEIAYFGASLLPWQESYLCAIDANTGEHSGDGQYIHRIDQATLEGPLAIAPGKFVVAPQGRVPPRLFSIDSGKSAVTLGGGGGSFVVVTPESVLHGPGNKTGWMTASKLAPEYNGDNGKENGDEEKIASFSGATGIIIAGDVAFVQTKHDLSAKNFTSRKDIWTTETDCSLATILAGNTLFAGGTDQVNAYDAKTGKLIWKQAVHGRAFGLAVSNGRLFVSTDEGVVHCFAVEGEPEALAAAPETPVESSVGLKTLEAIADKSALSHWIFQRPHVKDSAVTDRVGSMNAVIEGNWSLSRVNDIQALKMDGSTVSIPLTRDITKHADVMPQKEMTVECWARIDEPQTWGAFIGCVQDNGSYERGWLLGYNEQKPAFAICGIDGPGKLTYLTPTQEYSLKTWHHFAATYDGTKMILYVDGKPVAESTEQKGSINYPPSGVYVLGTYQDDNERFPLDGMMHEVAVYKRVFSADEIKARFLEKAELFPAPEKDANAIDAFRVANGPWLQFDSPNSATVRWETDTPSPSVLRLYDGSSVVAETSKDTPSMTHAVSLPNLRRDRLYHFEIDQIAGDDARTTAKYECDTVFNYSRQAVIEDRSGILNGNNRSIAAATFAINECGNRNGLCIVLGCGDGSLMYELAKRSEYRIIAFDPDGDRVERVRNSLRLAELYGERVSVHRVDFLDRLPTTGHIANLVVSGSLLSGDETQVSFLEATRILAPNGMACFSQLSDSTDWMPAEKGGFEVRSVAGSIWATLRYPTFEGSGNWSHIYGSADNTHYGGEALSQATKATDLELQWVGR